MITCQNSSTNHLYQALTETQLAQIQGGGTPYRERPEDFTHEKKPDFSEGMDLGAINIQGG